ncbi:YjbF family lipoprotein [Pseudosulfitobacter koreensis]|uniref:YjbF family lipoprotein n=1 Tax=Pseudosulfitobacter koreensis TaxID=2968472 RepID=A0ABT1Z0V6_9RHOB|nr:YjbF family lipoprotein [Pseudosulfitobacter koreense]MCR8826772.1 YjbF family lipoprotein [Pseudosulfitobacter koreense]
MRTFFKCVALAAILLGVACTGGTEGTDSQSASLGEVAKVAIAQRKAERTPAQLPSLTRPLLNSLGAPSLEIIAAKNGRTAYLIPLAERADDGTVVIWRTAAMGQVILRDGVLIGTKGLGRDLASADATPALTAVRGLSDSSGQRVMYFRNDVNGINQMSFACEVRNLGPETIEIVGQKFPTIHLQEDCSAASGQISNHYWIDRRDITVWKSRQWAGPEHGYFDIRLLKK